MFAAKGSRVFYSVYAMHRLPEIWGSDAQEYRPERWLDEKNPLRPGWGFLVSLSSPLFPISLVLAGLVFLPCNPIPASHEVRSPR